MWIFRTGIFQNQGWEKTLFHLVLVKWEIPSLDLKIRQIAFRSCPHHPKIVCFQNSNFNFMSLISWLFAVVIVVKGQFYLSHKKKTNKNKTCLMTHMIAGV